MKKKNGFTMVELMATIVILALVIAIAIPVYNKVSERQKEKAYENVIEVIALKAEQWAEETNLNYNTTITLKKLVAEGYYQADEGTGNEEDINGNIIDIGDVLNPIDNSSMLCYTIDITIENGKPVAKVNENDKKDCSLAELEEEESNVKITAYQIVNNKIEGEKLEIKNNETAWTKEDVLIIASSEEGEPYKEVEWSSGGETETKVVNNNLIDPNNIPTIEINERDYANIKKVTTTVFLKETYSVGIKTEEKTSRRNITVKIDKEAPTITILSDKDFVSDASNSRAVTIRGSDSGSGLEGFYVSDTKEYSDLDFIPSDYDISIKRGNGTYYVYAKDKVGNVSKEPTTFEVSNVEDYPSCEIKMIGTPRKGENDWYLENVTLEMTTSKAGGTGLSYGFGDHKTTAYYTDGFVNVGEKGRMQITLSANEVHEVSCYVKNGLGDSNSKSVTIKVDKDAPTITAISNPKTLNSGSYAFTNNVSVNYGASGQSSLSCDPAQSRGSGTYNVTCTAVKNNGLSASTTFEVKHSYPATYNHQTCTRKKSNCTCDSYCPSKYNYECDPWGCYCGSWPNGCCVQYFNKICCDVRETPSTCDKCTESYDCSYYSCPRGGSPIGSTCYY